jgi:hypothetical protein
MCTMPVLVQVCMFRLLKAFVRELSAPLIPRSVYDGALEIAQTHMRETVAKLQANPAYPMLIEGLSSKADDQALLTEWLARLWVDPDAPPPPAHLVDQCGRLTRIAESIAFSASHEMPELAEIFFKLPKANRSVLEYATTITTTPACQRCGAGVGTS